MELSILTQLSVSNELLFTQTPFALFLSSKKSTFFSFKNAFHFNSFNFSRKKQSHIYIKA